ncbi:MAG: cyclodeaminase/cyclohydrolase family protein [Gemmatimonadales bacterium]|nr:cyclodeaminase/cyclohydrolase family protein [Gemmatimonadales bacterium]
MPTPKADDTLQVWLSALAAPTAAPAGGAAAALAGALGAALVRMVAGLTGTRDRYATVHEEATDAGERAERLGDAMLELASRDAEAFGGFSRALAMPAGTGDERQARERAKADALRAGADVQLDLMAHLGEVAELAEAMAQRGLAGALGDAATAAFLAAAGARSAYWAVRSNLDSASDRQSAERVLTTARDLLERIEVVERRVRQLLAQRIP